MQRNLNVAILRLVAALMVLAGHMSYITGHMPVTLYGQLIQAMGVKILFLLGGVFITRSWMADPHPLRYGVKRFFRIWPPLAVYVLVAALVIGPFLSVLPVEEYYTNPGVLGYLKNLRLYINYSLPGLFADNPYPNVVNGSLWTLPVEVVMYILVPICCMTFTRLKNRRKSSFVALGMAVAVCSIQIWQETVAPQAHLVLYATDWVSALTLVPYYLIGMAFAMSDWKKYLSLPCGIFLMLIFVCLDFKGVVYRALFYPLFSYFILSLAFTAELCFERHPFYNLEFSYGIYLWGFFIQQIIVSLGIKYGWNLETPIILVLCTIASALFGILSCVLVERPMQKLCKRILCYIS